MKLFNRCWLHCWHFVEEVREKAKCAQGVEYGYFESFDISYCCKCGKKRKTDSDVGGW